MQSIRVLLSFYTLIMFGISSSSAQIFRSACRRDGLFAASARDKKQTNGLISSHNILRLPLCAKKCTSTATCMTINYKYQTSSSQDLNCELLNTNLSSSLSVAVGWVHYKPVRQVKFLYYCLVNICFLFAEGSKDFLPLLYIHC